MSLLTDIDIEIKGTKGYSRAVKKFASATHSINFKQLHKDFLKFIPIKKSQVLDIGSGIGRDAYELYEMGHAVTAIEPLEDFRLVAKQSYGLYDINWINDSLPKLTTLENNSNQFDFILSSAVWHHLDDEEQIEGMFRVSELLAPNGYFALLLRHGRAGVGTYTNPINIKQTIQCAEFCKLLLCYKRENQPSLMKNKECVFWTRLVFQKVGL